MGRKYLFFSNKIFDHNDKIDCIDEMLLESVRCQSIVTTWQCEIITAKYRQQQHKTFGGIQQSLIIEPSAPHMCNAIKDKSLNSLYTM